MAAIAATDLPHDQNRWEFSCDFEVDFDSEENASILCAASAVDKETEKVKRRMSSPSPMGKLSVHFEAVEARFLCASFSTLVDIFTLATKTVEELAPRMQL